MSSRDSVMNSPLGACELLNSHRLSYPYKSLELSKTVSEPFRTMFSSESRSARKDEAKKGVKRGNEAASSSRTDKDRTSSSSSPPLLSNKNRKNKNKKDKSKKEHKKVAAENQGEKDDNEEDEEDEEEVETKPTTPDDRLEEDNLSENWLEQYDQKRKDAALKICAHNNNLSANINASQITRLCLLHLDLLELWEKIEGVMKRERVTTDKPLVFRWSSVFSVLYPIKPSFEQAGTAVEWSNETCHETFMLCFNLARCLFVCSRFHNAEVNKGSILERSVAALNRAHVLGASWKSNVELPKPLSCEACYIDLQKHLACVSHLSGLLDVNETKMDNEKSSDVVSLDTHRNLYKLHHALGNRLKDVIGILHDRLESRGDPNKELADELKRLEEAKTCHVVYAYIHKAKCLMHTQQSAGNQKKFSTLAWHLMKSVDTLVIKHASALRQEVNEVIGKIELDFNSVYCDKLPERVINQLDNVHMEEYAIDNVNSRKIAKYAQLRKFVVEFQSTFRV